MEVASISNRSVGLARPQRRGRSDRNAMRLLGGPVLRKGRVDGFFIRHATIKVGTTMVRDVDVVQARRGAAFDAVGLLPVWIFKSIYISHTGGFIVLNPVE